MTLPGANFFESASNVYINGGMFTGIGTYVEATGRQDDPIKLLYDEVSPNAILNSGGRADSVQCYPGTREEVISKIMNWMQGGYKSNRAIFWLSGPVGAGKSSIIQTVAEGCLQHDVPMANFFFFRADGSRNHIRPVVPTILSQLFILYPELKASARETFKENPIILKHPMRNQFSALINSPIRRVCSGSQSPTPPIVLLIDGLDECKSEHGKNDQISLLRILHDLVTQPNSPFIVLVASRTEPHITMVFNEIGASPDSIFLDETYRPEDDIRRFLVGELSRIKRTHALRHTLGENWPPDDVVDSIVQKSSGQFIYAATVTRFVGSSPSSPALSMQIALGIRPMKKDSPFAEIDAIYTYILSQIGDWDSTYHILGAYTIVSSISKGDYIWDDVGYDPSGGGSLKAVLSVAGYTPDDVASALSELTSIVRFDSDTFILEFYHASFQDFLYDKVRGGTFFIDLSVVGSKFMPPIFMKMSEHNSFPVGAHFFKRVHQLDECINSTLQSCTLPFTPAWGKPDAVMILALNFLDKVEELYLGRDPQLKKLICRRWHDWFFEGTEYETYTSNYEVSPMYGIQKLPPVYGTQKAPIVYAIQKLSPHEQLPPVHGSHKQAPRQTRFQRFVAWFATGGPKRQKIG